MRARGPIKVSCLASALIAGTLAAGCGVGDDLEPPSSSAPRPVHVAPVGLHAPAEPVADPDAVLKQAATAYGSWTAKTMDEALRRTAALSSGPLHAELIRDADAAGIPAGRPPAGSSSHSTVEDVHLEGSGAERAAIVVTRVELSDGRQSQAAQYRVTLAELARVDGRWALTRWEPQP